MEKENNCCYTGITVVAQTAGRYISNSSCDAKMLQVLPGGAKIGLTKGISSVRGFHSSFVGCGSLQPPSSVSRQPGVQPLLFFGEWKEV